MTHYRDRLLKGYYDPKKPEAEAKKAEAKKVEPAKAPAPKK